MIVKTPKTFDSRWENLGTFQSDWTQAEIKREPMFFNASREYAYENGGPITRAFLSGLPPGWQDCVFDSRVHMLMPGWYPAIPGWHHDDVPRPVIPVGQHFGTAGQPDYETPRYLSEHIMGLVNGDVCPTRFAVGTCTMPAVETGVVYKWWSAEVDRLVEHGMLREETCPSGVYVGFDWQAFHTASRATGNGWRWFGRISRNTERVRTCTNEIRSQVQVYLEFPTEGW